MIWTPEIKFPGEPDYPFNIYLYDQSIQVKDGTLTIKPMTLESRYGEGAVHTFLDLADRCTGEIGTNECYRRAFGPQIIPPIISGKVTTKHSFAFKYGRIEVGARMPLGKWLIPEIQLEPRDNVYGTKRYASGLLRIACVRGNKESSKNLYGGPILYDSEPLRSAYLKEKVGFDQWSKMFHNYTLVWRPDGISLYVDGENYGNVVPGEGFAEEAMKHNIKSGSQWLRGTLMAPFDQMVILTKY
ncbi:unnamed protein product [Danaus chrysippus]|uniref:(African queen) hypothetical protein n=1 Tax=Danaus chrysippus TaxID=151541 RepID=A0A8J2QFH4_9NEOP|nr:unnamed protein product [Danaus chrysippus]